MGEENQPPKNWHNNEALRAIYCAALTGFVANRYFHEAAFQGSALAAHEFALQAVGVAWNGVEGTFES